MSVENGKYICKQRKLHHLLFSFLPVYLYKDCLCHYVKCKRVGACNAPQKLCVPTERFTLLEWGDYQHHLSQLYNIYSWQAGKPLKGPQWVFTESVNREGHLQSSPYWFRGEGEGHRGFIRPPTRPVYMC